MRCQAKLLCHLGAVPADTTEFPGFISAVNRPLKQLGLELARGHMEDSGEVWYGLVNRSVDSAAKLGSVYSAAELELFNKAVRHLHSDQCNCVHNAQIRYTTNTHNETFTLNSAIYCMHKQWT